MTLVAKGLEGIVANSTSISDVRGDIGQLIYAGYDIDELAGKVSFEETIHLLWHGELPNAEQLHKLTNALRAERSLPLEILDFLKSAPRTAAPMDVIRTGVSMLGLFDQATGEHANYERAVAITAKIGVIAAYFHRIRQGKDLPPIRKDLSVATLSDMFSAITSAIGTLKGPLHGGANEGVIHMLQEIGSEDKVDAWLEEQFAKKAKIMGIGHRVYKVLDPRAPHLRDMAIKLTDQLGEPKWIRMSEHIATVMREKKHLNANVDFYSATVYYSLGIPTDLFTPIFAISRTAGWTAHVLEQLADNRLYRPLSEYTGPEVGKVVKPIDQR